MTENLPPGWDDEGLADLHHILMWQLLRFTSSPLSGTADAGLVRSVLLPPKRRGITRVVLWNSLRPGDSVAYDLPLVHPQGDNIPWTHLIAALRQVLARPPTPGTTDRIGLDVSLRDDNGRVRVGNTTLMAALPSLLPDELASNPSPTQDPYAPAGVYDFTHW